MQQILSCHRWIRLHNFANVENENFIVNRRSQQKPIMTPAHLTELRLEIIATHIVHCCAYTATNFTLEKYSWLPEKLYRAALSTQIVLDFPDGKSVSTTCC